VSGAGGSVFAFLPFGFTIAIKIMVVIRKWMPADRDSLSVIHSRRPAARFEWYPSIFRGGRYEPVSPDARKEFGRVPGHG
jgi:hypothetical protein